MITSPLEQYIAFVFRPKPVFAAKRGGWPQFEAPPKPRDVCSADKTLPSTTQYKYFCDIVSSLLFDFIFAKHNGYMSNLHASITVRLKCIFVQVSMASSELGPPSNPLHQGPSIQPTKHNVEPSIHRLYVKLCHIYIPDWIAFYLENYHSVNEQKELWPILIHCDNLWRPLLESIVPICLCKLRINCKDFFK